MAERQKPQIKNWHIVGIHLLTQALANLLFGLSLAVITLYYIGFSLQAIETTIFLYLAIYFFIFVPFYSFLPLFLFRGPKRIIEKINCQKKVKQKEIAKAIEILIALPLRISIFIPITVWLGFGLGAFVLWKGLIPEFVPFIELIITSCMSIGFGVGLIHSFLNYIFLDHYTRPIIDYLGFFYHGPLAKIKIKKIPLAVKVFFVVLLVALASQVSLWAVLSAKIGINSLPELKSAFFYFALVSLFTLVFVFIIAVFFSQNITYPLKKLIDWSGKVIAGQTKESISLITNDETLEAVQYLKKMVQQLQESRLVLEIKVRARTKELRELSENLEVQVKQRTKELEQKVKELKRFQKAVVGRELKMIELKKKIGSLEKQIKAGGVKPRQAPPGRQVN